MNSRPDKIHLRGHHLFCVSVSNLEGDPIYNPEFCANQRKFQERMRKNPFQAIEVVPNCGDTCLFCPSRSEKDNKCVLYDYAPGANQIDLNMLRDLGLQIGDELTFSELNQRIKKRFGTSLPEMCFTECGFAELLRCAEGLEKL